MSSSNPSSSSLPSSPKLVFINLPVADLDRAIAFYERIGATKNPQFSDHTAACMVVSDVIHVMLLTHPKFRDFTPRAIADARQVSEVLICLSAGSRAEVDSTVEKAVSAGGKADPSRIQEFAMMYGRSFEDPDGHIWEIMWMDPAMAACPEQAAATA